eukprot:GHVS01096751.1.p1 GENE.GHVS01096751.1~~GHVS01096751.1.p1  ORF type:complete len:534 (+),score=89.36 GHVS01096751.1:221-1822(+)
MRELQRLVNRVAPAVFFAMFELVFGNNDILSDVLLPIKDCPHGFELLGKSCGRVSVVQPEVRCTRLWEKMEGEASCVTTELVEGTLSCGDGYSLEHARCVKMEEVAPERLCPKGFVDDEEGSCSLVSSFEAAYVCGEGYRASLDGTCFRESRSPADAVCQQGYQPGKNGCVSYEAAAAETQCRWGYTAEGGRCVRVVTTRPEEVCAEGFHFDRRDGCVKVSVAEPIAVCNEGTLERRRCRERLDEPAMSVCRKGFHLYNGKCVRVIEEEMRYQCKRGFVLKGDRCIAHRQSRPELLCETGFALKWGRCEAVENVDAELFCVNSAAALVDGVCVLQEAIDAVSTCPRGFQMTSEGCKRTVYAESELVCKQGTELRGKFCVNYETTEATKVCNRGKIGSDGRCTEVQTAEHDSLCPRHFRKKDQSCLREVAVLPEVSCSEGALVSRNGMCRVEVVRPADIVCPKWYSLEMQGCTQMEEEDLIYRCKKGYKLIHRMCVPVKPRSAPLAFEHKGKKQDLLVSKKTPVKFKKEAGVLT